MPETFGQRLRTLRQDAGLSQPALACRIPVSQSSLSRYESDRQTVDADTAARLDDLLNAHGALRMMVAPAILHGRSVDRERLAHIARQPRTVDVAALDSLATVLAGTRRLEDAIGAASVLEPARSHVALVKSLVVDARGPVRRDVVNQAGQWAQHFAWLHTALERYDDAARWFSLSLEWAIEADDDDLAATVWSFKAHLAWLRGEVGSTVGLTQVARRYQNIYSGQSAYDALQEARGHAAIGDAYQVERLVDQAAELSDRALRELPDAPPWHYYRSPAFWDLERGRALYQLPGRAQKAVDLLAAGLSALPSEQSSADWVEAYRRDLVSAQRLCG